MLKIYWSFQKFLTIVSLAVVGVTCYAEGETPEPQCSISEQSIKDIQFEETVAGKKIPIIDQLTQLDDANLEKCLKVSTDKELMALTILDLSRHTNEELAKKAKALSDRFNLASYIAEEIKSGDESRQNKAVDLLLRIKPDQAKQIIDGFAFLSDESKQDINKMISDGLSKVLIPTDSNQGDRYYVRASWDPKNEEALNCLTKLFNEVLLAKRSLDQEKVQMQKSNGQRWVYWYSKEWIIGMADAITECGGKASFVGWP